MMDYEGFWRGFLILFGVMPILMGASAGAIWAWRTGRRGTKLITAAMFGGVGLSVCVFVGAILFFRA